MLDCVSSDRNASNSGRLQKDAGRQEWAPSSPGLVWVTNGRVARELPVASALLIRQELAQKQSFPSRQEGPPPGLDSGHDFSCSDRRQLVEELQLSHRQNRNLQRSHCCCRVSDLAGHAPDQSAAPTVHLRHLAGENSRWFWRNGQRPGCEWTTVSASLSLTGVAAARRRSSAARTLAASFA